ncbi:SDR family NAD(P)-dependent oxidoreductase [Streptomyces sp. NPDC089799]|uniref:SDR family NAD(P)-dependent oxidoreductase n=1 Tax=Streptomyces sp. NPDC089799 TaxID=3155066 RepID=UPI003439FDCF
MSNAPVAVVGYGAVLAGASGPEEVWDVLEAGRNRFRAPVLWNPEDVMPPEPRNAALGGFIDRLRPHPRLAAELAAGDWPADAPPVMTFLRHSALQALDGLRTHDTDRWLCAAATSGEHEYPHLYHDVLAQTYARHLARAIEDMPGARWLHEHTGDILAAHYQRDSLPPELSTAPFYLHRALEGLVPADAESVVAESACASSLYALDASVRALQQDTCDIALCTSSVVISPSLCRMFAATGTLSTGDEIRPFDERSSGTRTGEGSVTLVLKRLDRARSDGDTVHAVIRGIGLSADGRAASIHAPAARGQSLALGRAWREAGISAADLDWIIAHGTGTARGDEVELGMLREALAGRESPCPVTSAKAVFGHTIANAGLVSLLHAVLGLRHDRILRQPHFERLPAPTAGESADPAGGRSADSVDGRSADPVDVPVRDIDWPRGERPRTVAVCSAGLGGVNGHVILTDDHPSLRTREPALADTARDDIVIVARTALFPGAATDTVDSWLRGEGPPPGSGFGDRYPHPTDPPLRIPPPTLRQIDRTQIMSVQAVRDLAPALGAAWDELRPTTAVVAAAGTMTRRQVEAMGHIHLNDAAARVAALRGAEAAEELRSLLATAVTEGSASPHAHSFTGAPTGLVAGRVANYHDLQGPITTCHADTDSTLSALRQAQRWLHNGSCDLVLVCAADGNTLPEADTPAGTLDVRGERAPGEGAVVLAVTRARTASRHGLPVLATVRTRRSRPDDPEAPKDGQHLADGPHYRAAAGALAVLRALTTGADTVISPRTPGAPAVHIAPAATAGTASGSDRAGHSLPEPQDGALQYRAMDYGLHELPPSQPRTGAGPDLFGPGTLVLCDDPLLADLVPAAPGVHLWSPAAAPTPRAVPVRADDAATVLAGLDAPPRHVRILTRLPATTSPADTARVLALHDLAFAVTNALAGPLATGSITALLTQALPDGVPHPFSGLFTGSVRSFATELPDCASLTVLTGDLAPRKALDLLAAESAQRVPGAAVVHLDGKRLGYRMAPAAPAGPVSAAAPGGPVDAAAPAAPFALDGESVILAAGGARGLTPSLLLALTADKAPHLYVLGRTPLPDPDAEPLPSLADHIRRTRAQDPSVPVKDIKASHARLVRADEVARNLALLREQCGADRVHYLTCDLTDAEQVTRTVRHVLDRHGRIDLLLNTATEIRSRALGFKPLADFRTVRDIKVLGYLNLKDALRDSPPRLWCNFSSMSVVFGNPGDADYVAGNDFLTCAARRHTTPEAAESSLMWAVWSGQGAGADPLLAEQIASTGRYEVITPSQGAGQLLQALAHHTHVPALAFIGPGGTTPAPQPRETASASASVSVPVGNSASAPAGTSTPAAAAAPAPAPAPRRPTTASPLLGRRLADEAGDGVFERRMRHSLDPDDPDPWIAHHTVKGLPVVPGTFALEIAAEAALTLAPQLHVVGFRDLRCHSALTVLPGHPPLVIRTRAHLLPEAAPDGGRRVRVRILTDRTSRNGTVLVRDRLCHSVDVLLSPDRHPIPTQEHPKPGRPAPGIALHHPNPLVQLTGPFASTTGHQLDRHGAGARFALAPHWQLAFEAFVIPALTLDAMIQTAVLATAPDDAPVPLAALAGIDAIDLATPRNDTALTRAHPAAGILLHAPASTAPGSVHALVGDTTLVRMHGIHGAVLGTLDRTTGRVDLAAGPARSLTLGIPDTATPAPSDTTETAARS